MPGLAEVLQEAVTRLIARERSALNYRPKQTRTVIVGVHLTDHGTVAGGMCHAERRAILPKEGQA